MHRKIYREFEEICRQRYSGQSVLEIGAVPSDESLLFLSSLSHSKNRIGINIDGPYRYKDIEIKKMNANSMEEFVNDSFDLVLCNATLEHDRFFWKSLDEIKRVARSGGVVVIGTPGFKRYKAEVVKAAFKKLPLIRKVVGRGYLDVIAKSTLTFEIHGKPGDYYRFSPQAFEEVFMDGLKDVEIRCILSPPRIIGVGEIP